MAKAPNKVRPAIVVDDSGLFHETYQNLTLLPLTSAKNFVIKRFAVEIAPSPENELFNSLLER